MSMLVPRAEGDLRRGGFPLGPAALGLSAAHSRAVQNLTDDTGGDAGDGADNPAWTTGASRESWPAWDTR